MLARPNPDEARRGKPRAALVRGTSVMTHAISASRSGAVVPRETSGWDADTALEQLYAAHWRQLVRLSVLLVRDVGTAEEVVQDAFVAVHGHWKRLRDPDRALAYLRQTVVNRSRSVLRHRAVVDRHAAREAVRQDAPGADQALVASTRRAAVLDAMRALPERQREVLALRYYLELSEAEIAEALGISRGAVKSHASRGAAALRQLLADHLEDRS
jgi:RNA polymerase sigma-70 factor (sigma-E family)